MYAPLARYQLWPHPAVWNGMLRGVSAKFGLDPRHTIICHLASKHSATKRVPYEASYHFVKERIVDRAGMLAFALGFDQFEAHALAERIFTFLEALDSAGSESAIWATPDELLAIDRAASSWACLDGNKTLTTNLAEIEVSRTGTSLREAKRRVHARVAAELAALATDCGFGLLETIVIRHKLVKWLNSFDR